MATTRVHGGKALEEQVIRLHKEGWHLANIASIAKVNAETVREILKRRNIISM
jgi:lambda repressor-like predicted transcriptional regulator